MALLARENALFHWRWWKELYRLPIRSLSFESAELEFSDEGSSKETYGHRVPFLYLPHTAQKAYHVHWSSTSIPRIFDKYKWLTKSLSSPGLPNSYNMKINSKCFSLLNDSLIQAAAFQKSPKNKNELRYFNERISFGFFANVFPSLNHIVDNEKHNAADTLLCHKPLLETHWPRNYKFYHTEFRPTFVIKSKYPLSQVESVRELTREEVDAIPGPFNTYDLNVYEKSITHLRNRPSMDNSNYAEISNCHTSIMVNNRLKTDEQIYAGGLMACFSQALSNSLCQGNLIGTDIQTPNVTHAIVTNGRQISFFCFQLNTLNLMDDKGIWNRLWYTELIDICNNSTNTNDLYETVSKSDVDILNKSVSDNFAQLFGI